MQISIQDYESVNTSSNYQLANELAQVIQKCDILYQNPETEINQIISEELKRIRARTWNKRKYQQSHIEVLEAKKKIQSLRKQVGDLKSGQRGRKVGKHTKELSIEYSILKKELEIKTQLYKQQVKRKDIQLRQISSLTHALLSLDETESEFTKPFQTSSSQFETVEIGISSKLKYLKGKKKEALETKYKIKEKYQQVLRERIGKLSSIEEAVMERELLEKKLDDDLNVQREILNSVQRDSYGVSQPNVKKFRADRYRKKEKYDSHSEESEFEFEALTLQRNPPYQSIQHLKRNPITPQNKLRTISIDKSRIVSRQLSLNQLQKVKNARTPLNLTPSKYSHRYNDNQKFSALPRENPALQSIQRQSDKPINLNASLDSKGNSLSNYDTSVSSSMYNRNRKIELIKESFVELSTINEEVRGSSKKGGEMKSRVNGRSGFLSMGRGKASKATTSETTKDQSGDFEGKVVVPKGIPFQCNKSESGNSFQGNEQGTRQIPKGMRVPSCRIEQF